MIIKDFNYFKENRDEIIKEHKGEFVVIKNAEVLGYYKTEENALKDMIEKEHELGSFIIQKCVTAEEDKVMYYTRRVAF